MGDDAALIALGRLLCMFVWAVRWPFVMFQIQCLRTFFLSDSDSKDVTGNNRKEMEHYIEQWFLVTTTREIVMTLSA